MDFFSWLNSSAGNGYWIMFGFRNERAAGKLTQMLFEQQFNLFPSWQISFHLGVDGISIAMITAYCIRCYCRCIGFLEC
jgi:NADH:ubiquinone oxidoreductase subunit 4 (subunit M)